MKKFVLLLVLALGFFFVQPPEIADARRFGRGGSFGSRPSYSQKFAKPAKPAPSPRQQAAPGAPMGGRGMFGGMLGGMLMGGLLGSLLFGGGFHGPNFMDILLIGGGLFLLVRFLRARQMATQTSASSTGLHRSSTTTAWDALRTPGSQAQSASPEPQVPAGFDAQDFLAGAKAAYTRLQASWDQRNLNDIRQFTSDAVYQEVQAQAAADPTAGKTEILLLEAHLLEVRTLGNQTVASVLFDAMLRENGQDSHAEQVREAWHFSRYESGGNSHWVVEGIQQLEH